MDDVRNTAYLLGYEAHLEGVFVGNPYQPGNPKREAWRDGYELGTLAARADTGAILVAANDDGDEASVCFPCTYPRQPWVRTGLEAVDRFIDSQYGGQL